MKKISLSVLPLSLIFLGCGGDSNKAIIKDITTIDTSVSALSEVSDISFANYYRNGLYVSSTRDSNFLMETTDAVAMPSTSDADYSTTITQEQGVDESDRIKYNGDNLFIAARRYYQEQTEEAVSSVDYVRILQRENDSSMSQATQFSLSDESNNDITGLYLYQDMLTALSSGWGAESYSDLWYPVQSHYTLSFVDVSETNNPNVMQQLTIDGYVISSRQIDNKLFVVSTFSPQVDGLIQNAVTEDDQLHNYNLLQDIAIAELMPSYIDKSGVKRSLVTNNDCLIPEDATATDANDSMVVMSVIDVNNPSSIKSTCVSAHIDGIYVSQQSVYLYGVTIEESKRTGVIHKFDMSAGAIDYLATGNVDGDFGFDNSQLRFNEHQQYLRVVSTSYDSQSRPQHQLSVFEAIAGNTSLQLVGQLPNDDKPEKIGKENESIYAVRYFNDKAYVVTFERTDPLYVIDLKEPTAPAILGSLEIPGYSAYLHPISEDLILGIGQQVNPELLPAAGSNDNVTDEVVESGAHVSLFDVSDPSNPAQLSKIVYPDGYTPAQYNYHALTYLKIDDGKHLLALPVETWRSSNSDGDNSFSIWTADISLELLEINGEGSQALLQKIGDISPKEDDRFISSWDDRSVIHGDDIYYIHGNQVWHSLWSDPQSVDGPY